MGLPPPMGSADQEALTELRMQLQGELLLQPAVQDLGLWNQLLGRAGQPQATGVPACLVRAQSKEDVLRECILLCAQAHLPLQLSWALGPHCKGWPIIATVQGLVTSPDF